LRTTAQTGGNHAATDADPYSVITQSATRSKTPAANCVPETQRMVHPAPSIATRCSSSNRCNWRGAAFADNFQHGHQSIHQEIGRGRASCAAVVLQADLLVVLDSTVTDLEAAHEKQTS
jgi:hypothetical protein